MRTGKVHASLRISVVSPEPILFTHVKGRPKETSAKGNQPKETSAKERQKSLFLATQLIYCPREGTFRGSLCVERSSTPSDSMYLMSVTPPTVFCQSFLNCTYFLS